MNKATSLVFSLVTNTTCTMKCHHCYQTEDEFNNKTMMTKDVAKSTLLAIEELYKTGESSDMCGIEVYGGETFLMPYEFWEWFMPELIASADRVFNITGVNTTYFIITNLMYKDDRYTDFIRKYNDTSKYPRIKFSTSWDMGTNRFGNNNKLLSRWEDRVLNTGINDVTVVLTQELVDFGARAMYEYIVDRVGMETILIEYLAPLGNAVKFEVKRPTLQDEVSFIKDIGILNLEREVPIDISPLSHLKSSVEMRFSGMIGSEKCYTTILPTGKTHMQPFAGFGMEGPEIWSENWLEKFSWVSTETQSQHVIGVDDKCHLCSWRRYCKMGYKDSDVFLSRDMPEFSLKTACARLGSLWYFAATRMLGLDIVGSTGIDAISDEGSALNGVLRYLRENEDYWSKPDANLTTVNTSSLDYLSENTYIASAKANIHSGCVVVIDEGYFINIVRKAFYFDDKDVSAVMVDSDTLLNSGFAIDVVEGYLMGCFRKLFIPAELVVTVLMQNPNIFISKKMFEFASIVQESMEADPVVLNDASASRSCLGDSLNQEFSELLCWLIKNNNYQHFPKSECSKIISTDELMLVKSIEFRYGNY
ncbi:hypothetical protein [Photobacterium kishitanii]|uniref:Radical SAM protein n=1 Tax=Photobacterium kishitanii TaxID=318456 RepID=A0A2T3KLR0_9GAMM|nr:hypothetical protein [Photobacterium kishitanii]PSV00590.1 hypothetical protein C9J27_05495 [Photobacterium kishitanii]